MFDFLGKEIWRNALALKATSKTWTRTLKNLDPEKRGKQLDVETLKIC